MHAGCCIGGLRRRRRQQRHAHRRRPGRHPLKLSGTAAKGAAIASAQVDIKCATGSGTATTGSDGTFTLTLATGVLPCVLRAPLGDGTFLHSAIGGSGAGDVVVNITPLTQLVVAQAAGVSPARLFEEFATRTAAVTTTGLTDAVAAVKTTLLAAGVDLGNVDPVTAPLIVGQGQDLKIDALVATLAASGTTLTQLTETVVASSPVNTSPTAPTNTTTSGVASLPADLLLKPAAANCAALRSGPYRVVLFESSAAGSYATDKITIDAATLGVVNSDGSSNTLIPVGTCRYTTANAQEIVVSQAGVIAFRAKNDAGVYRNGIAFPEQAHTVAELAGVWNSLGFERDSDTATTFHAEASTLTFDGTGKVTAANSCADVKTCVAVDATTLAALTLSANTDTTTAGGGFNFTNSVDHWTDRIFAYRAGGGELMLVDISGGGSFSISTRQRTNTLPEVGTINRSFDVTINSSLLSAGAVSESGNTIKTTDSVTGAYSRTVFGYFNNGATFATWDQSLQINQPRAGYNFRLAETGVATSATGVLATNRELTALGLRGMGLSAVSLPFNNTYILSVAQPGGPWLPPESISKPFAANCSALRSGTYRVVAPASDMVDKTGLITINAATLAVVFPDGSPGSFVANGPCRFTSDNGKTDIVVSQAGVMAWNYTNDNGVTHFPAIAFPEQTHTVAELEGTWNKLGYGVAEGATVYTADSATATINAAGAVTGTISYCAHVATCVDVDATTIGFQFAGNVGGGFDRTSPSNGNDRFFAYRAGNGDLMLLQNAGGSFGFWTQQRTNALPTVGVRTRNWDLNIDGHLGSTLSESSNTIASVDTTASTAVRTRTTSTGATYPETLQLNSPRNGYSFRPAVTVTASDSSSVNIREFTSLSLRGMGITPLKFVTPTAESYLISVTKP